nr:JmjC domain-containing protein [Tanacetum cinerariifolium]
ISKGGGDFVSSPKSNEAPQTPAITATGGAKDSAALTALSLKLDRCIHKVTSLENELGVTKKVLGGAVLKLVTRVKRSMDLASQAAAAAPSYTILATDKGKAPMLGEELAKKLHAEQEAEFAREQEELAQKAQAERVFSPAEHSTGLSDQRRRELDAAQLIYTEVDWLELMAKISTNFALSKQLLGDDVNEENMNERLAEVLDVTNMPFRRTSPTQRRLRKPFTSSASNHFLENISPIKDTLPAGEGIPAATLTIPAGSTPIPAGSSMDLASQAAAAAPSYTILATDKGKAPMLGEELAKKLHAEQEAEFAREQEELAQKAQAERVFSPAEHSTGLSDQRRRELDAAQLIYTEVDWLELMAKISTNFALSKQLLGDDVNEENMNERLGMLLIRKRRELAEQTRVKPMTKTQQRDYMRDFVKNQSAFVYNQGWTMKQVLASIPAGPLLVAAVLVLAASSVAADISVPVVPPAHAAVSVPAETEVHTDESRLDDPHTASEHVSTEPTVDATTPSSSCTRRKHLAKKRVHVLEMVDGRVMHMFVDVSYPLSAATLQHMLKHGLEVPKLLVGGDLTMAEQLVSFIKAALLTAQSTA